MSSKLRVLKDRVLVIEDKTAEEEKKTEEGVIIPAGAEMKTWREGVVVATGIDSIPIQSTVWYAGDPPHFTFEGEDYVSLMDLEIVAYKPI